MVVHGLAACRCPNRVVGRTVTMGKDTGPSPRGQNLPILGALYFGVEAAKRVSFALTHVGGHVGVGPLFFLPPHVRVVGLSDIEEETPTYFHLYRVNRSQF